MNEIKTVHNRNLKVVSINIGNNGSTGNIMKGISRVAEASGFKTFNCYPKWLRSAKQEKNDIVLCSWQSSAFYNLILGKVLVDKTFWFTYFYTQKLLKKIKQIKPDIIHLHNIHNWVIHCGLLFNYIKRSNVKVIYTLHDCWSFTGRCPYFTLSKCDKYKTGCHNCPYPKNLYPYAWVDRSMAMWQLKKEWFSNVKDLTIVTPSQWLAGLVKQSFLKDYPVRVINNGIDLSVFKPVESDFKQKYGIKNKFVVLGVAMGWGTRKGLDVFIALSKRLGERYQIVLVGTNDKTDKLLPNNIISIHKTANQHELAQIYSQADVFANPTREEVLGMVNLEALACACPVVTFNTGGSPECINEFCGLVVDADDINSFEQAIRHVCEDKPFSKEACLTRAQGFDMHRRFQDYIELYNQTKK